MKRLFTFVITMLLGASLAFAQGTTGSEGKTTGKKATKTKKAHKGGKKSKKSSGGSTTPPPK
ncbi:MAG TPA: hypothetical protein VKY85_23115 [Candidatus Angelobacter sp.]|nr:hypothetical protein [Candidatus Angelobacter sp.]